jgi:alpha-tubulin suppressor-like RCC1 family protein
MGTAERLSKHPPEGIEIRSSGSRVATMIGAVLLVAACTRVASPAPITTASPSGGPGVTPMPSASPPSPSLFPPPTASPPAPSAFASSSPSVVSPERSQVAAGYRHTCALTGDGAVVCWGNGEYGTLGNGATTNSNAPVEVSGLASGVSAIDSGFYHACALTSDGRVTCWGNNERGQLGDGTTSNSSIPVEVDGLAGGVTAIAAGGGHTCAIGSDEGVKCWGNNEAGQLGDGTTTDSGVPVDVADLASGVSAIAAGAAHTCALTSFGGVMCWGADQLGQLGNGTDPGGFVPVNVSGLGSGVSAIAAGGVHSCALTNSRDVKCWGVQRLRPARRRLDHFKPHAG